jgi:hypothetical protein
MGPLLKTEKTRRKSLTQYSNFMWLPFQLHSNFFFTTCTSCCYYDLHCPCTILVVLQQNLLPFVCPQDFVCDQQHPSFVVVVRLLPAIYLHKPLPSCIPERTSEEEWGLVNGEAISAVLHDQSNDIHRNMKILIQDSYLLCLNLEKAVHTLKVRKQLQIQLFKRKSSPRINHYRSKTP